VKPASSKGNNRAVSTFATVISGAELTERLNADYYAPSYRANQALIERFPCVPMSSYYAATGIGHTAAVEPHYATPDENSIPFIAGGAINQGFVEIDACERL
jgi:hypothetical protein